MRNLLFVASLSMIAACAVNGPDEANPGLESSKLLSGDNAVLYRLDGSSTLNQMGTTQWLRDWTHVVPIWCTDDSRMVLVYGRETGVLKLVRIDGNGGVTVTSTLTNVETGWDYITATHASDPAQSRVVFYRRDGSLTVMKVTGTGTLVPDSTQAITPPADVQGWDRMVGARMSPWGDLVFYSRLHGEARLYRFNPVSKHFEIRTTYSNWKDSWDEIVAGDLDGDGVDDLAMYSAETGELKLLYFDDTEHLTSTQALANAEPSAGAQLMIGAFGGSSGRDVAMYNADGAADENYGRIRVWRTSAGGARSATPAYSRTAQDAWTHVVSMPSPSGMGPDWVLFYSNQQQVEVEVLPFVKRAGTFGGWSSTDLARAAKLELGMRKTYAAAGISFHVTLGTEQVDANLATWDCSTTGDKDAANAWIASHVGHGVIPIVLPVDSAETGAAGCSGLDADFVKSSYAGHVLYDHGYGYDTEKHWAHEIGHYFGLAHSYLPGDSPSQVATSVADADVPGIVGVDQDREASGWLPVADTYPALTEKFWIYVAPTTYKQAQCDTSKVMPVGSGTASFDITVQPYNVMDYNQCSGGYAAAPSRGMARLSHDQIRAVRQTLYGRRSGLL